MEQYNIFCSEHIEANKIRESTAKVYSSLTLNKGKRVDPIVFEKDEQWVINSKKISTFKKINLMLQMKTKILKNDRICKLYISHWTIFRTLDWEEREEYTMKNWKLLKTY